MPGPPRRGVHLGRAAEAAWEAVLSIFVAMAIGYYLDQWLETEPILMFILTPLGLIAGFRRLIRLSAEDSAQESKPDAGGDPPERDEDP